MEPTSRGFSEVRDVFFRELVDMSKNTLKDDTNDTMAQVRRKTFEFQTLVSAESLFMWSHYDLKAADKLASKSVIVNSINPIKSSTVQSLFQINFSLVPLSSSAHGDHLHAGFSSSENAEVLWDGRTTEPGGSTAKVWCLQPLSVCPEGPDPHEKGDTPNYSMGYKLHLQLQRLKRQCKGFIAIWGWICSLQPTESWIHRYRRSMVVHWQSL